MQSDLRLDFADILILEYAALAPRSPNLHSFLSGLLTYTAEWLPGLQLAEGLVEEDLRCLHLFVVDVAAHASLGRRANSPALKRKRRHQVL